MPEINLQLLPETRKKIEVHSRGENSLLAVGIVLGLLVGGIYFVAYFYHSSIVSDIQSVDNDLAALEQSRDKTAEGKLLTLYKKLKVVSPILNSHFFWSDGLIRIEKLVQPQVKFKTLTAQVSDKTISIKAEAASYSVVARQLAALLSDPDLSNVSLGKVISLPTGRVEFNVQFNFDPVKVLTRQSK